MRTDNELLRRYVEENSEAAFAEVVGRHVTLIYSVALRQLAGDTHLAEDVTQLVFTALARKARALLGRQSLAGWLYLGAHHAAANLVRGEQRRRVREKEASTMEDHSSPDASADWDRMRLVLDRAMEDLRRMDREAVILRFFEKRPFAEIGAVLHQSEDAARMRVDRALCKLHGALAKRGVNSTTAGLALALGTEAMVAATTSVAASVTGAALTGAGAGTLSGTTCAFFFFMNKTSLALGTLALAGIVGTGIGLAQARRSQADLALANEQSEVLQTNLRSLAQRLDHSQKLIASLQNQLVSLRRTTSFTDSPQGRTKAARELERREELSARPQNINATYGAFYHQLSFTAAQKAQFRSIFGENTRRTCEMIEAAAAIGPLDSSTINAISHQSTENLASSLAASFGEADGQAFDHYQETLPIRNLVSQIATLMYNTNSPLVASQADQLVEVIAANSRTFAGQLDSTATLANLNSILVQAQGLLSAPQMDILRQLAAGAAQAPPEANGAAAK